MSVPSILLFNARSLHNKLDDLCVRVSDYDPDVIIITETWLDSTINDLAVRIPGYKLVRQDRNSRGGGVVFYYKLHLSLSVVSNEFLSDIKSNILCCKIDEFDTTFCLIYHPYWGKVSAHSVVIDYFQSLIDKSQSNHFVIAGDINDLRFHIDDFFVLNDLQQLVTVATRGSNVLDIIACNFPLRYVSPKYLAPLGRSDHKGVFLKCAKVKPVTTTLIKVRSFTPTAFAACKQYLSSIDWEDCFFSLVDLNEMVEQFQMFLFFVYMTFSNERTVRMRNNELPWMNPSLKALSDARDRALKKGNHGKFLMLREKFQVAINKAKKDHFHRLSSSSVTDQWKTINSQLKDHSSKGELGESFANVLNDRFCSAFSSSELHSFCDNRPFTTNATSHVSEMQVVSMIMNCRSNSAGPDGLPGFFIRAFVDELAGPLTEIYNRCLKSAVFPSVWKCANIHPIPKGTFDFRPISILPFLSKVLERLIRDRILLPALNHQFDSRQFGFIPNSHGGCTNALLAIRMSILEHISNNSTHYARLLAIDFKKAFDSVNHCTLLNTLINNFGCDPFVIKFIHSFLSDRIQRVSLKNTVTPWKHVTSGVPQGSILGPLLFVMLIDDLPQLSETKIVAYADDITLVYLRDNKSVDNFQCSVDNFCAWANNKNLVINVDKTKCLHVFRNTCNQAIVPVTINDTVIDEVQCVRILGVDFSNDLRWDHQFDNLFKKCCRSMSLVKRLKYNCNRNTIIWKAYMGTVYCHIVYCWPVICDIELNKFKKLEHLDCVARRWCNVTDKPSLRNMLDKSCIKLVKKIAIAKDGHPLAEHFQIRSNPRGVRKSRTLFPLKRRAAFYNKSFVKFSTHT